MNCRPTIHVPLSEHRWIDPLVKKCLQNSVTMQHTHTHTHTPHITHHNVWCACVCTCTCIHLHTLSHTLTNSHTHTHTHIHTFHTHSHTNTHTHTHSHTLSHTLTHSHTHMFRILKRIGCGHFGTVSKGVWLLPGEGSQEVAVKTVKSTSEIERIKLLQEAAIMGQFAHPNVVRLHGVVTVGDPVSELHHC